MSFRTTYTGALDTKLAEARAAGSTFITVTNSAAITTGLTDAANKGQKKFTLNYSVSYQPSDLRLLGPLWEAFKTGVEQGLASQDIMGNEVTVKLNTADNLSTSVDLLFTF
jgi:secreted protein with Ig-like and vWFA domain